MSVLFFFIKIKIIIICSILYYIHAIYRFYTELISEIGFALILNCIIIPLAARNKPMPRLVRKIFLQKLAYVTCCRREEDVDFEKVDKQHKQEIGMVYNNGYMNSSFNENISYSKDVINKKKDGARDNNIRPEITNGGYHKYPHMNGYGHGPIDTIPIMREK